MSALLTFLGFLLCSAEAQPQSGNVLCTTAPIGDNSNRCASTAFVIQNAGPGGGGISSLSLILPNIFSVTGSPVVPPSGTITGTFVNQSANQVLAGPTTGGAAAPTFRSLVTADMPAGTGTVTSVGLALSGGLFTVSGSPVATTGTLTGTLTTQSANQVFAGPASGAAQVPTFRGMVTSDLPAISNSTVLGNFLGGTAPPVAANVPTCQSDGSHFLTNNAGSGFNCTTFVGPSSVANSDGTLTVTPTTGAVVASLALGHANTWTAVQTFTNSDLALLGSSTGATTFTSANAGASNFTITVPAATDTLVTLAATQTLTNKSIAASQITGQLPLANGGTNANLTASNGGIFYSTASAGAILAGTVTAGQCLLSGSSAAPTWGSCSGAAAVSSVANSDGTLTVTPTTGAVVASLALGHANTWTAVQTFTNSDLALLGSSTGATTFTSANAGASNFTITVPAATDTLVTLAATQTLTNKSIAASEINSGLLALARGGTNADLSATGGASQVLKQSSLGGAVTVAQLACADLSNAAASCSTDSTNAGNISSGTLVVARGGTGATTFTASLPLIGNGTSAIAQGSVSGTTTTFGTTTGTLTSGHCVSIDASGNLMDAGAACAVATGTTGVAPQGRLTLQTNTPVMTTSQSAQGTLRYDCYIGNGVPYYTGSADAVDTIASCEVTDVMATSGTGVLNAGGVFDVWWVHGGTNRICVATNGAGGGWASDTGGSNTARGTGYSQIDLTTRPYSTNKNALANCYNAATNYGSVPVNQATFLGTIATDAGAAGRVSWTYGGSAAGGSAGNLNVWNMYNRVVVPSGTINDSTTAYSYTTAAWRQADNSTGNRANFVLGLVEDSLDVTYQNAIATCTTGVSGIGIGVNSTSAPSGTTNQYNTTNISVAIAPSIWRGYAGAGSNFISGLEFGGTGCTFNNAPFIASTLRGGLSVLLRM